MGIIGKLIGGTIGFAMGGPLGAVAGAVFGHAYDASKALDRLEGGEWLSSGEQDQLTFFVAAFSMLAKLAKSDGRIKREEVNAVEYFISKDLRLSSASRKVALDVFLAAINTSERFEDYARQFYGEFSDQPQMLEMMIDILFRVSVADGELTARETALIKNAADIFRMSARQYDRLKSKYISETNKAYAILKSSPGDSMEIIKKRYRKLVSEYHPDKIASKGLPEDFIAFANDRFREIHAAYEEIKKERGYS